MEEQARKGDQVTGVPGQPGTGRQADAAEQPRIQPQPRQRLEPKPRAEDVFRVDGEFCAVERPPADVEFPVADLAEEHLAVEKAVKMAVERIAARAAERSVGRTVERPFAEPPEADAPEADNPEADNPEADALEADASEAGTRQAITAQAGAPGAPGAPGARGAGTRDAVTGTGKEIVRAERTTHRIGEVTVISIGHRPGRRVDGWVRPPFTEVRGFDGSGWAPPVPQDHRPFGWPPAVEADVADTDDLTLARSVVFAEEEEEEQQPQHGWDTLAPERRRSDRKQQQLLPELTRSEWVGESRTRRRVVIRRSRAEAEAFLDEDHGSPSTIYRSRHAAE